MIKKKSSIGIVFVFAGNLILSLISMKWSFEWGFVSSQIVVWGANTRPWSHRPEDLQLSQILNISEQRQSLWMFSISTLKSMFLCASCVQLGAGSLNLAFWVHDRRADAPDRVFQVLGCQFRLIRLFTVVYLRAFFVVGPRHSLFSPPTLSRFSHFFNVGHLHLLALGDNLICNSTFSASA